MRTCSMNKHPHFSVQANFPLTFHIPEADERLPPFFRHRPAQAYDSFIT